MEIVDKQITTKDFIIPQVIHGRIISDQPFIWNREAYLLAGAYIPGFKEVDTVNANSNLSIHHIETPITSLEYNEGNKHISLKQEWNGKIPLDLYHLIYSTSRVLFHCQNLFPIHGACIGDENGYKLIVGHSGVGKTSLALSLIQNAGLRLFSGNKTLIDFDDKKMKAIAGTPTMTIKDEDRFRWGNLIKDPISYWGRLAFEIADEKHAPQNEVPITGIVLPKINENLRDIKRLSQSSALHTLYPFFMDQVNADTIVGENVYLGTSPRGTQEYIVQKLQRSLVEFPVLTVTGPMDYLVEQTYKL